MLLERSSALGRALVIVVLPLSSVVTEPLSSQAPGHLLPDSIEGAPNPALIIGTIVEVGTDSGIAGATITLAGTGTTKWTDEEGRFVFRRYELRFPDTLVVHRIGYDSARIALPDRPVEPVRVRVSLQRGAIAMEGFTVEGERRATEAEQVAKRFGGRVWRREDFPASAFTAQSPLDVLRWSGMVSLVQQGRNGERCVIIRRGLGCALIMLDNVRTDPRAVPLIPPEIVESFVVLRPNEASIPYGTGAGNGVVVIFTRTGAR